MAKQNFLAGGYYGKLGATVGQRWRNKRTIRVYVKTPNPDTPKQRENRGRFKQAIQASQTAMVFNKGTPAFYTEGLTEFQYRTSTAKQRIDAGLTGFAVLPFFPNGYTPSVSLTGISARTIGATYWYFYSQASAQLTEYRDLMVSLTIQNTTTQEYEEWRVKTTAHHNAAAFMLLQLPAGYTVGQESKIFGVSTDDADHNDEMIYFAEQPVNIGEVVTLDDFQYVGFENQWMLLSSAKVSALATNLRLTLNINLMQGLTGISENKSIMGIYAPTQDEYIRCYVSDPYTIWGDLQITGGTVDTTVSGKTFVIPEQTHTAEQHQRLWQGESTELEYYYVTTADRDDNGDIYIYSNRGYSTLPMIAKFVGSYPYRDSGGRHTATLDQTVTATGTQQSGIDADCELLVSPDYPEQSGDTLHLDKIGIGTQYYLYGLTNVNLPMDE